MENLAGHLVVGAVTSVAFVATLSFSRTRAEDIQRLNRIVMEIEAERKSGRHALRTSGVPKSASLRTYDRITKDYIIDTYREWRKKQTFLDTIASTRRFRDANVGKMPEE
ncbi:hypothetical protein ACE6H2_023239 [Prunus campanulata]